MSHYLAVEVKQHPGVQVMLNTQVRRFTAGARAMFVFVGAEPYTGWLANEVALDSRGYILTGLDAARSGRKGVPDSTGRPFPLEIGRAGVIAAGDVRNGSIKRVASAVSEGAMAVRLVHEPLQLRG
ncbi:hypothetical protein F5972_12070 [Microbispora cellulosiformans]|uniref:FAD/NAD(P)-binding domain-containing protein n=1 Tax=Microbispora cellulosiformans TaxID=2614688 RepID=A0A5J5K4L6_9ACTN|nr:hypothetical protein [Microbispora cellulosiformans]KAA9378962.1 hypothetical protein F5972_12070 [Microbispora cellulosiformans]